MKYIFSKKDPTKLLHIINTFAEITDRTNVIPDNNFLQLATLKMERGTNFRPHKHIWKPSPTETIIAQESWVVICGSVKVFMYDIDGELLETEIITKGDCSITLEGGHTYEILEENTVVYEYKTGPYLGIENDKVFL
jgi:cupin fold WbuC family metalloprotein